MIELILAFIAGAALASGGAFFLYRPKFKALQERVAEDDEIFVEQQQLPPKLRKFRVIMSTDGGGEARRLFERLVPKGDGMVEFYDGDVRRSLKEMGGK